MDLIVVQKQAMWSDSDVPWPWSNAWMSLDVVVVFFSLFFLFFVCQPHYHFWPTRGCISSFSHVLGSWLQSHEPYILNNIVLATVVTGTWSYLKIIRQLRNIFPLSELLWHLSLSFFKKHNVTKLYRRKISYNRKKMLEKKNPYILIIYVGNPNKSAQTILEKPCNINNKSLIFIQYFT